jgi:ferric iron reductase protein FhuF
MPSPTIVLYTITTYSLEIIWSNAIYLIYYNVGKVKRWKGGEERERGEGKRDAERERKTKRKMTNFRKIQESNEWNLSFSRKLKILGV